MRETRTQVLAHHIRLAVARSAMTERSYLQDVAETYMQRTPLHARVVQFHASADPYTDERANAQLLRRMLDGTTRLHVDLEESLIEALPEPYRTALVSELARRNGLMLAPSPATTPEGQLIQVSELMARQAETIRHLAPMFDDQQLDANDRPHAQAALRALEQAQSSIATMRVAIMTRVLGDASKQTKETTT